MRRYFDLQPVLVPICAILLAFAVGSVIILLVGKNPIEAYWALLRGMWAPDRIAGSLGRSTPFIGAALAVAFAFRAGLFNIGVEGPAARRRDRGRVGRHVGLDRRPARRARGARRADRRRRRRCALRRDPGRVEGAHRRARGDHDDHAQRDRGALHPLARRIAGSGDPPRHDGVGAAHRDPAEGRPPARRSSHSQPPLHFSFLIMLGARRLRVVRAAAHDDRLRDPHGRCQPERGALRGRERRTASS